MIKKLTAQKNDVKKIADELNLNYNIECLNKPKVQGEDYVYSTELLKKDMPIITQIVSFNEKFDSDQELVLFLTDLCRVVRDTDEYKARRKEIFEIRKKIDALKATELSKYTQMSKIIELEDQLKQKNTLNFAGDESDGSGLGNTVINMGLLERAYRDIRLLSLRVKKNEKSGANQKSSQ